MMTLLSAVVAATLALAAIEASAQATPGERQVALTIESSTLADALDQWAQQTGFQLFVRDWEGAKSLSAPSLKGTFTAQAALDQLLAGTPLTYVWLNERAVSIRKKRSPTVPAALQRTEVDASGQPLSVSKFSSDTSPSSRGGASAIPGRESSTATRAWGDAESVTEEVLVTGSHIRGAPSPAPMIRLGKAEIERSGYLVSGDLVRSLPQNFSGGNNPQVSVGAAPGGTINQSVSGGTAPNLRGLGPGSTLTLVNGHRLGSDYGGAVDVSLDSTGRH